MQVWVRMVPGLGIVESRDLSPRGSPGSPDGNCAVAVDVPAVGFPIIII